MKRTLIQNATIVNEGRSARGSVVIEGEKIAEVLEKGQKPAIPCEETIHANGCYLIPGVIDDHVHFRDPGLTHKADISTESRAAAAGGVTSIMDMPNTNPQTTTLDALNAKFDLLAEKCSVNYSCYFGATNNNYTEFDKLDKNRVCGIKLFMGSSTGNMLVDKMNSLLNIFNGTDLLIAAHCENHETIKKNTEKYVKSILKNILTNITMFIMRPFRWVIMLKYVRLRLVTNRPNWLYAWHALQMHACISCISLQPENFHCLTMISR